MKRTLKIVLPLAFLLVATAASFLMVRSRPEAMQKPTPPPALLVEVAEARLEPVRFRIRSQGTVAPRTETTLVSEVSGQIVEVAPAFVSGGMFEAGEVLIRIDPRNYETAVKRARAAVARASTQIATEQALAEYAAEDYRALQELNDRAAARAASDLQLRKPQVAEAEAELASAEAELEQALGDLDRTIIRAPYEGMVREKIADVGQFVPVGAQLARTFAIDRAEVRLPLTPQDLRYIDLAGLETGATLDVTLQATIGGDGRRWDARITRSEGVFDATSRVLNVVATIDDPYGNHHDGEPLRIGTFVTATIEGRDAGELFAIPRHSLQRGTSLWIVDDNNRIQPRIVDVVRSDERYAYVASGLSDGDRFVTTPIDQPLPGMQIRLREEDGER